MTFPTSVAASLVAACLFAAAPALAASDWMPAQWEAEDTLQFRSDCPDEGEHWSYVWLVVLDGDVWVRLGSKAASRIDCTTTKPVTAVKIRGQLFSEVEFVNVPEMAERVATAMANKYMTDVFVAWMDHPYTMKLVPKDEDAEPAKEEAAEKK